jgi:hypothetical protein
MKTTKFYWNVHITGTHATQGPAAFGTSTSPLLQCTCLSMWSREYLPIFAAGPSFSATNRQTAMSFSLIPIAHHNQFQPLINSLNSRPWWWAAHLELIPPYWAFHLATCKPINPQHSYVLNQVFRSNVLDLFCPQKLYHYLTDYIYRN